MKKDLYAEITQRFIDMMKEGTCPWSKPWKGQGTLPLNWFSKRRYNGLNVLFLWHAQTAGEYSSPAWVTYKQAKELGGNVKKGEKSTRIYFWKILDVTDKENPDKKKKVPLLRHYSVFNLDQCENIPEGKLPEPIEEQEHDSIEAADQLVANYPNPPAIHHGKEGAWYKPALDLVGMPNKGRFNGAEEYYSTLFHELIHSTGSSKRIDRGLNGTFGSCDYSKEELVAELGAAFLRAECGFETEDTTKNSAAYLQGWLKALSNDHNLIVSAASKAAKAAEWIKGEAQQEQKEAA